MDVDGDIVEGYILTVCGGEADRTDTDITVQMRDSSETVTADAVTVRLMRDEGEGAYLDQEMTLNADNQWKGTFRDLYTLFLYEYDLEIEVAPDTYEVTLEGDYVNGCVITLSARQDPAEDEKAGNSYVCHHSYEWETIRQATATSDGEMRYQCRYCRDVQYSVPITAYYTFNQNTQEAILQAAQGETVTVQTPLFISFHEMVYKALQERPDVTLVVDYRNGDGLYEMTIPAGSGDELAALFGESRFAGFLYLGGTYAVTELPRDTVFDGMTATQMWFGTTTAH